MSEETVVPAEAHVKQEESSSSSGGGNGLRNLVYAAALLSMGLTVANIVSSKIITIAGLAVPAGGIAYGLLTYPITDTISEVYGKQKAKLVVTAGFIAAVAMVGLVMLTVYWPAAPIYENQAAFASVLGMTPRIVLASLVAYIVSQRTDVEVFHWLKESTGVKLWVRNNVSTLVSQLVDTVLFITIAFYGVIPILPLIGAQYVVKTGVAVLDTPIVVAASRWLKQ